MVGRAESAACIEANRSGQEEPVRERQLLLAVPAERRGPVAQLGHLDIGVPVECLVGRGDRSNERSLSRIPAIHHLEPHGGDRASRGR